MNSLNHVAIIMDGNGRWGLKNKKSRNAGHKAGLNTVEKIIKETIKNKIKFLIPIIRSLMFCLCSSSILLIRKFSNKLNK